MLWIALWTLVSCVPTVYVLHNSRHLQGNPELRAKYDAFYRTDVDKWNLPLFAVIQFFTFIPCFTMTWAIMFGWVAFAVALQCTVKKGEKFTGVRFFLFYWAAMVAACPFNYFRGVFTINNRRRTDICYKKYLGPDWTPTFDGAGISISNHLSWLDIPMLVWLDFPSFVAKQETLNVPAIGKGSQIIQCLYLKRGDTKEKRAEILR